MPRNRSQTVVTVGSRSQIYCHRPPAPSPAAVQLSRFPKQPFTWTNGVMGAVSPLPLYTEEGKLEARAGGAQERGLCMVSPDTEWDQQLVVPQGK